MASTERPSEAPLEANGSHAAAKGPADPEPTPHRRAPLQALLAGLVVPGLVSGVLLAVIGPSLLVLPTTPTGFDLGGHVYPLSRAVEELPWGLPTWSDGWFGGFPLYYFYFPLPAFLVWLVNLVAPFEVAVKLVSVVGILGLPFAAYVLARGVGFGRPVSVAVVLGAGAFAFMQSFFYLGGNLSSTLAGEFSYGLGFTLSLVYLGIVARTARGGPRLGVLAALVLAATALSHVLPTAVVVIASLPLLTIRRSQRPVFVSWVIGFMLAGFWTVPFLLRSGFLPEILWAEPQTWSDVLPREIWLLLPLAIAGAVLTMGKRWAAVPLLIPPALALAFYAAGPGAVHPGRLLPYWFFAIHILAAVLMGGAIVQYVRTRAPMALLGALLGVVAFSVVLGVREYRDTKTWATWNYSGYETKPGWPAHQALIETFRQLPPGRVHFEDSEVLASYGSLNAPSMLPYWSPEHPIIGGLWLESSLTAPAYLLTKRETSYAEAGRTDPMIPADRGLDLTSAVHRLRLLGVRYYVAFTPEAIAAAYDTPGFIDIAQSSAFEIFELPDVPLVEVASAPPEVHTGSDFQAVSTAWFDDLDGFGRALVADGPDGWPRAGEAEDVARPPFPGSVGDPSAVSDVRLSAREISFTTTAVGAPHFVKATHFPNWRAEGALGPYLAAPSYMVVVPNRETVRISFQRSWVDWTGILLSVLGAALFLSGALHHGVTWAFLTRSMPGEGEEEPAERVTEGPESDLDSPRTDEPKEDPSN